MKPHGLRKTPSPKFVVPHVSEHESGSASRTVRRFSSGSVMEPPVESWTMRSVASRTPSTASLRKAGSSVGWCSRSRTWMWMRAAPARSHATAVSTSSSGVVGSAGTSALAVSAPVGAMVISVLATLRAGLMRLILPARRLRLRSRGDDDRLRGGEVVDEQLERRVGVALDHRERDGSVDVVARDGGDPADDAVAGADLAPLLRQDVPGAVEVQEDEAARR